MPLFPRAPLTPATKVVATLASGYAADYYTTGTNDHTVINTALSALPATGGTVLLKDGTYVLGGSIQMASFKRLVGMGKGTILTMATSTNAIFITGTTNPTFNRYVEVSDLKIDGTNNTSGGGISCYAPRNNVYQRIWFYNVPTFAVNLQGDATNLGWYNWVDSCEIDSCPGDGIVAPGYAEHAYIIRNTITFCGGMGIHLQSDSDLIQGNQLDHCGGPSILVEFGSGVWRIMDNFIDRPQDHCIIVRSTPGCIVRGNTLGAAAAGKALVATGRFGGDAASNNLIVSGNMMVIAGGSGSFGIQEIGLLTDRCRYEGNIIRGPATAVSVNASSTNLINSNTT